MKSSQTEVTLLIERVRNGSDSAAMDLWGHFQKRLFHLAKRFLQKSRQCLIDDEEVANQAFHSFLQRFRTGDYPSIERRDDAWRMLAVIVVRKAINTAKYANRQRRALIHEISPPMHDADSDTVRFSGQLQDTAPSPDVEVMIKDSINHLMVQLPNEQLRQIAKAKMMGYTNEEVACQQSISIATVERRLRLIRGYWEQESENV